VAAVPCQIINPTDVDVVVSGPGTAKARSITTLNIDDATIAHYNGFIRDSRCAVVRATASEYESRQIAGFLLNRLQRI